MKTILMGRGRHFFVLQGPVFPEPVMAAVILSRTPSGTVRFKSALSSSVFASRSLGTLIWTSYSSLEPSYMQPASERCSQQQESSESLKAVSVASAVVRIGTFLLIRPHV